MTIYTQDQKPTPRRRGKGKGTYTMSEAALAARRNRRNKITSEQARLNALSGTPEERSERSRTNAKGGWTPERRAEKAAMIKRIGMTRKGHPNKNPYPFTEAVINRIKENPNMAYKGRFRPNNPQKYSGDPTNIIYRSGIELRFMSYLDSNPGVVSWVSEETIVPYFDPATNRYRRYFPDFLVVVKHGTGTLTQLIEIKPLSQTLPPKGTPHQDGRKNRRLLKEQLTYITNQAKFAAATEYAADRGWKFKVITDKDIQGLK